MIDPGEIEDLMQSEEARLENPDARVWPLSILDVRGGELRWESERQEQDEDPRSAQLSEMADRFIERMERKNGK